MCDMEPSYSGMGRERKGKRHWRIREIEEEVHVGRQGGRQSHRQRVCMEPM